MTTNDLCTTCVHDPVCTLRMNYETAIVYCEKYLADRSSPNVGYSMTELKGLCRNCNNRFICVLIKPEGGVWHCNDYQ